MARYTGAVCRLCRRSGDKLFLKGAKCYNNCTFEKRPTPPGPKPARRRRISDRGLQLRDKQKARFIYGMLEKQFRGTFEKADRMLGVTGDNLLLLLERRLDNVVYRLGFADSRAQARQLVRHGHIEVNNRRTNIPSCVVREGDAISFRENSKKTEYYKQLLETIKSKTVVNWLSLDRDNLVARVLSLPTPEDAGAKFEKKTIVEFYSR
ncbi:MAG: 30S ribosomal protein S4 [Chloroflexota bacterium]